MNKINQKFFPDCYTKHILNLLFIWSKENKCHELLISITYIIFLNRIKRKTAL